MSRSERGDDDFCLPRIMAARAALDAGCGAGDDSLEVIAIAPSS